MKGKTYYQPELINTKDIPEEIASFMVFPTEEDCKTFMDRSGYLEGEYEIYEYHDDDIEEPTFLNGDGEDISAVETEEDIDDVYRQLMEIVKGHHVGGGDGHKPIEIPITGMYETLEDIYGVQGPTARLNLQIKYLTEEFAITADGFDIPYDKLEDVDSFEALLQSAKMVTSIDCENPDWNDIASGIEKAALAYNGSEEIGVVVEDTEGEIRNITAMWYDRVREMVRLKIGNTKFEDADE